MNSLESCLAVDVENRDDVWEQAFLKALPRAEVSLTSPEPQEGPDHWPYLLVEVGQEVRASDAEPLLNVIHWLSTRGIGLAINVQKPTPDYVMTFGMIWNFRERGEFLTRPGADRAPQPQSGNFEIENGQQILTGLPSESFLPSYVRSVLKQFLMDQGVFAPKIILLGPDQEHLDLCFSIESLKSPPAHEHANIAEALAWFLPGHYAVSLVSEKVVPGFTAL